ncbi:MAG: hypothetical protein WBH71_05960 [Bacteroidales bacterium]|jgi:hypothetical protein|nr:hypothetical protein [Bacteroidota bacterium]OQC37259.1 MAG: hypothetical protein BWX63_01296 [Bacteroidetes bacterium ADurb.Bin041]HNV50528.1 hypothetical protein [Bacteroidales bacterium]HOR76620.1 hypothetical protein [Bacteroidales bacterium]HPL11735.1 hypothetical protein [Bacteroidales bacterium]
MAKEFFLNKDKKMETACLQNSTFTKPREPFFANELTIIEI